MSIIVGVSEKDQSIPLGHEPWERGFYWPWGNFSKQLPYLLVEESRTVARREESFGRHTGVKQKQRFSRVAEKAKLHQSSLCFVSWHGCETFNWVTRLTYPLWSSQQYLWSAAFGFASHLSLISNSHTLLASEQEWCSWWPSHSSRNQRLVCSMLCWMAGPFQNGQLYLTGLCFDQQDAHK